MEQATSRLWDFFLELAILLGGVAPRFLFFFGGMSFPITHAPFEQCLKEIRRRVKAVLSYVHGVSSPGFPALEIPLL